MQTTNGPTEYTADPPTPEQAPPSKTGGCRRDARGYATTWSYRRVRQPLIVPRRSRPKAQTTGN